MENNEFDLLIEAGKTEKQYFRDLWSYRELFYYLSWRDILVRYKQTVIGVAWSVLRPFLTMVVFTIVFGNLAKMPSDGYPYPILVFAAMLPWQFFSNAMSESSNSLVNNAGMISKIYFPRIITPVSSIIVSFVDFLIAALILIGIMIFYKYVPDWRILTIPFFTVIAIMASLGAGFWFSSLTVKYRDFKYVVPFVVQFGLYISPVGFSSSVVPDTYRLLYSLNPMVGVIDGFRWAILGGNSTIYMPGFILSVTIVVLLFVSGLIHFRKTERFFADII